ncbi:MAG TPA: enoyl-CoA hydratase-related protein, partial [Pirellulaceae bacterium]|nr:enoyl-CoA hydratase-related protein [Pirellulaceae bacterium]
MMSGAAAVGLSFPEPDIGLLTIDSPGKSANLLSRTTLDELAGLLDSLADRTDLAGVIVVSGKPGTFIAGADVRDLAVRLNTASPDDITAGSQRGQAVLRRLASLPAITVAAIDGPCVGGGAELASWCDLRIVSDNPRTEIGFPEVKLGIFPGWGGTARLPRLIGLSPAVEMITGGELIGGDAARKCGWADDVVPASELVAASIRWIRHRHATSTAAASTSAPFTDAPFTDVSESLAAERARRAGPVRLSDGELDLLQMAAGASIDSTTGGRYPAPGEALSLLVAAAPLDIDAACRLESERFPRVFGSPVNKALVNVYFLRERIKRDSGLTRDDLAPRRIERVGVVGAGIMGGGIAAAHLKCEVLVRLHDAAPESLARGAAVVLDEAAYDRKLKRAEPVRRARLAALLETPAELERLAECDLVVEAIVESAEPKRQVFERLEPLLGPEAILASNT